MKLHPNRLALPFRRTFPVTMVLLGSLLGHRAQAALNEAEILAGADDRIEKHRKTETVIRVVDSTGDPVAGAKVAVEQTRHAFLFGCNIFQWEQAPGRETQAAYRERFADLLNYATLGFYWRSYERQQGRPLHAETERVARWCQEHGILTKGHPLAWNMADPPWLPDDPDEIYRLQLAESTTA